MRHLVLFACAMFLVVMPAHAAVWQVTVQNYEFVPASLPIAQGDTVVWSNVQGSHNVLHVCGPALFGNAVADAPWVYQFVFDVPAGHYPYLCEVHPDIMVGEIVVQRPTHHEVVVASFSFTPALLEVVQGDTVTWRNTTGTHSVHHTGNPSLFDSGNPASGGWTYSFIFNVPLASYPYICELHPSMQGTIVVQAPPSPPVSPADVVINIAGDNAVLTWSPVPGATCYTIHRGSDGGQTELAQLIGATDVPTFVQPVTALSGDRYFFQVRAVFP